jgi:hypothetical protein
MTDLHDILPPPGRTNSTPLLGSHPGDHNEIVDALNDLGDLVDSIRTAASYRVFDTIAGRDGDVSAHVEGMLAWANSEMTLALWHGEWIILQEPFQPWVPVVHMGAAVYALTANRGCGFRHEYGSCRFYISLRVLLGTSDPDDVLYVEPPLVPTSQGGFGVGYVVDPTAGSIGGLGLHDEHIGGGSGAPPALAIGMPGVEGLMARRHLAAVGEFDLYMSGFYATAAFA